ncbi:VanZ family protein [Frateuria defendens]|uniref:VanZ family protein n=1 Tax=Frateuria defendens TaxID=2219559 RepID=UPI00066FF2BA|nr:VanZ family protein [Frateuria defendens]
MGVQTSGRLDWHRVWFAIGVLLMAWILWQALRPDPAVALAFPYGDKLLHAITFTCLMGWWGNVYRTHRGRLVAAACCLAYGIAIEVAQGFDPPRDADPLDVLADAAGIALALIFLRTPLARVLVGIETLLRRRSSDPG